MSKKKNLIFMIIFVALSLFLAAFILVLISMNKTARTEDFEKTLSLGAVELNVENLDSTRDFYVDLVGLEIITEEDRKVVLGKSNRPVIVLIQQDDYRHTETKEPGLYHSAILFTSRIELAQSIDRIISNRPFLYQGSSDHMVSEAFYFSDPEGNGLELYFDKPTESWEYDELGRPRMGSIYIDEKAYIERYAKSNREKTRTDISTESIKMGHIHLRVGNIAEAKAFYVDVLMFDIITESDQTLFISKDNYHHHIGMNTWETAGTSSRTPDTYGLKSFSIWIHSKEEYATILEQLKKHGVDYEADSAADSISFQDPWGNAINLISQKKS